MLFDSAVDGPEVKLIAFFHMYPEGSFSRRVGDITEDEMKMRFMLFELSDRFGKRLRFEGRIPDGPLGTFSPKRAVSAVSRRKPNTRRTAHKPRLPS